jgi:hypothetical protein
MLETASSNMKSAERVGPVWWVTGVVIVCAVLLMIGAVLALVRPGLLGNLADPMTTTVRVYADYVVARDGVLAIFLVLLLVARAGRALSTALLIVALIQAADVVLDAFQGRVAIVPLAAVIAIACITAAVRHSDLPLWRISNWRER